MKKQTKVHLARFAVFALVLWGGVASAAVTYRTYTWKGGESGEWQNGDNWESSDSAAPYPKTGDDRNTIYFTNSVVFSESSRLDYTVVHVAEGCSVSISTAARSYCQGNSDSEVIFDIAENAFLSLKASTTGIYGNGSGSYAVRKIGSGTITVESSLGIFSDSVKQPVKKLTIEGGSFIMNGPQVNAKEGIVVSPYARFETKASSTSLRIGDAGKRLYVEEGGLVDFKNCSGILRSLEGSGVVTNIGSSTASATLRGENGAGDGNGVFGGKIYGYVNVSPTNGNKFVVGSADTLAGLTSLTITTREGNTNVLGFNSGIGTFYLGGTAASASGKIFLEDEEGKPVALHNALKADVSSPPFAGSGSVYFSGSKTVTAYTNDLSTLSAIGLASGTTFSMYTNDEDLVWSPAPALYGEGSVSYEYGPGAWTIGRLSLTGSTFTVSSSCKAPSLTIAGGVSTNLELQLSKSTFHVNITGGDHHFRRPLYGHSNRTYLQTGGHVRAVINDTNAAYSGQGNNEIFYTITGGTLESVATADTWTSSPRVGYGCGVGLEASGDAKVFLRAASSANAHVVGNRKKTVLRVSGNAVVDADMLYLFSYWGGSSTTGTVDLAGGTLKISNTFGYINNSSALKGESFGEILFRGGTFETTSPTVAGIPNFAPSVPGECLAYVGQAGGTLKVSSGAYLKGVFFRPSSIRPYGDEADGGLTKAGVGYVVMTNTVNALTGPLTVRGSSMAVAGVGDASAWNGSVALNAAELRAGNASAATVATLPGSTFTFANGSTLTVPSGVPSVSIGPAGAGQSALGRVGHGSLVVRLEANGAFGTDASVTVAGGVPLDPNTGIAAIPVFGATDGTSMCFLSYDAERGFVAATPSQGIPADADGTTVANVYSTSATLSSSAHVGALSLTHTSASESASDGPSLTIASGATLTVGNGVGTIAPVLLNSVNMSTKGSGAKISGGTLSFGAAEGLVMVNQSRAVAAGHLGYSWSTISSKISGTGGVTFGSFDSTGTVSNPRHLMVSGVNDYTGGTWIENVSVFVTNPSSLGSGTVTVEGTEEADGGQLAFDSDYAGGAFANNLVLSGNGICVSTQFGPGANDRVGAVRAHGSATLTGAVTLAGDTTVSSRGGEGCVLDFAGVVSGAGRLSVGGDGVAQVRLSGSNTYAGGTVVKTGGYLRVSNSAALGSGPVKVDEFGVLAFESPLAAVCGNEIDGDNVVVDLAGEIVESAPFECSLPITNSVPGTIARLRVTGGRSVYTGGDFGPGIRLDVLDDGSTLDLGGGTVAVDYVRGSSRVVNGTLVVRIRDLGDFGGTLMIVR